MTQAKPLILVVDDETHILHVVSLKLQNAGFIVITAEDGEEGCRLALENLPDLIITDYQMPYMTGLELAMELKKHEQTRAIPCLMLTARGYNIAREQIDQTNIAHVLSKPFSPREVLSRVQELIESQRLASEDQLCSLRSPTTHHSQPNPEVDEAL